MLGKVAKSVPWFLVFDFTDLRENTYEDNISLDPYSTVGPCTFDATAYERTPNRTLKNPRVNRALAGGKLLS